MSALKELVDKVRRAVAGTETPAEVEAKPFEWEPAPVTGAGAAPEAAAMPEAAPAETPATWKRPAPASSVVGASIPADVEDFATVYKGAGIQPPMHGYGVDRVGRMLGHRSLVGLDRGVKASAVLAALDGAGVALEDVVQDSVLRYKALVAFEAAKDLELQDVKPRNERRIEKLKEEIAGFQETKNAQIEQLNRETSAAVQTLNRLRQRTRAEEERYQKAIALFVEPLPARVLPMTPREGASEASETLPTKAPDLKLLTTPAAASPAAAPAAAPAKVDAETREHAGSAPQTTGTESSGGASTTDTKNEPEPGSGKA